MGTLIAIGAGVTSLVALPFWVLQSRPVLQYLQTDNVRFFYPTQQKILALTIDDGPDPEITPRILDVLKQHRAKATFFLIGRKAIAYPELVQRIVDEGHDIGNHDYDDVMTAIKSKDRFERDFIATHQALSPYLRADNKLLFRPGCGWYTAGMIDFITRQGYKCVLGNIYPHDVKFAATGGWGSTPYLSWYIQTRASPGSIIILHDSKKYLSPDRTLDQMIPQLQQQGYEFVTISQAERS